MSFLPSFRRPALLPPLLFAALTGCAAGSFTGDGLVDGSLPNEGDAGTSTTVDGGHIVLPDSGIIIIVGSSGSTTTTTSASTTTSETTETTSSTDAGSTSNSTVSTSTTSSGSCLAGLTMCADGCTDTTSDPDNCGTCGNQCKTSQNCANSACTGGSEGDDAGEDSGEPGFTCSHSPCSSGAALEESCDQIDNLVELVCHDYPDCCKSSHSWTEECAQDADYYCNMSGQDECVDDPGC